MILDEADAMTQDAQNALRRGNYTGIALPKLNTAFYPMKLILEYSNRCFSSCVLPLFQSKVMGSKGTLHLMF